MVTQAYCYTSAPERLSAEVHAISRQAREVTSGAENKKVTVGRTNPGKGSMIPSATPSQPVVIPTRTRQGGWRRRRDKVSEVENTPARDGNRHDLQSIPPSVAALLAITSIPGQRLKKRSQCSLPETSLVDSRSPNDGKASSLGSLEILLSLPHEVDSDNMSCMSDSTMGLLSPVGSPSALSIASLEADTNSWGSASSLSSPRLVTVKRHGGKQRPKAIRSLSEDCRLDHPLLPGPAEPDTTRVFGQDHVEPIPVQKRLRGASKSTFKSHLTASLRTLKSAAASLSGLSVPTVQQDDYIARTALSISLPFTDERRPASSDGVPDPALRRYLNPASISPAELHFHHHRRPSPRSVCTASIQLRTIQKGDRKSAHATAPPVFAAHPLSTTPTNQLTSASTRQREPRENSDFLRMIVLEMNMRRAGKLSHTAPGRARLWLPARPGVSPSPSEVVEDGGGILRRWVGQVP